MKKALVTMVVILVVLGCATPVFAAKPDLAQEIVNMGLRSGKTLDQIQARYPNYNVPGAKDSTGLHLAPEIINSWTKTGKTLDQLQSKYPNYFVTSNVSTETK